MRSMVGLIVGVGLGILLMYFSVSTFRVTEMMSKTGQSSASPEANSHLPVRVAEMVDRQRESALGNALAERLRATCKPGSIVLVLCSRRAAPAGRAVAAALRKNLSASGDGIEVRRADTVETVFTTTPGPTVIVCPDHDELRRLMEKAATRGGTLPPLYTAGWSSWLARACARESTPIAGVALIVPAGEIRLANRFESGRGAAASAAAARDTVALVFSPADIAAVDGAAAHADAGAGTNSDGGMPNP